jgi:hypothetical protein
MRLVEIKSLKMQNNPKKNWDDWAEHTDDAPPRLAAGVRKTTPRTLPKWRDGTDNCAPAADEIVDWVWRRQMPTPTPTPPRGRRVCLRVTS